MRVQAMRYAVYQYMEPVSEKLHDKEQDCEREAVSLGLGMFLGDMFEAADGVTIEQSA